MLLFVNEFHLPHRHILPFHDPSSLLSALNPSPASALRPPAAPGKKKKKKKKKKLAPPSRCIATTTTTAASPGGHGNRGCAALSVDMAPCAHVRRSFHVSAPKSFVASLFPDRGLPGSVLNSSSPISVAPHSSSSARFSVESSSEEEEDDDGDGNDTDELDDSATVSSSSSSSSFSRRRKKNGTYSMKSLAMDSITADQIKEEDLWHFRHGPLPGDLAEIETFCRIFRAAEQVHNVVMEALCKVNNSRELIDLQSSVNNDIPLSDLEPLTTEDVPLLEEKVVSSLGCIGALLHQQKQEVIGGRLNQGTSAGKVYNTRPPLAQFRANMKKCCEQLEALLLCYFPVHDVEFKMMHKKLQKLHNICFDAGYPREKGSPNHADIPNWGAVKLQTQWNGRTDSEIVFWRGGQLTDDGVDWLIEGGFKVVVDLRTEPSRDYLAKSAMNAAVSSGKLKRVSLPIEPGNVPTKDQVIEFCKLVADPNNKPLYLHSQQGVGRTSAMVTKWREVNLQIHTSEEHSMLDILDSQNTSANADQERVVKSGNEIFEKVDVKSLAVNSGLENRHPLERPTIKADKLQESALVLTPFESQRPPKKSFSQREMSKFLKGKKITPTSFNRRLKKVSSTVIHGDETDLITETVEPAGRWCLDGPGIPRAGKVEVKYRGDSDIPGNGSVLKDDQKENIKAVTNGASSSSEMKPVKGALNQIPGINGATGVDDGGDDAIVGDMCASTTGVVRVQSRKKAEMYLVRTDGFSCTRERVKESTLAFTHPSTQQQMLMWKTAPKTVLLLKKLGPVLIEETELVASFLHYQEGMNVIVEPDVHDHLARIAGFGFIQTFHSQDISVLHERVDFIVCLGGDGVILHASNLFRDAVPPVVSFNLGSLGFLTAHPFEDFIPDLKAIIHGNTRVEGVYITLRMRLQCEIFRNDKPVPGKVFDVLNEVVVDRGSNPYLCKIECYERNRLITKVQADGVIVATPTGSTAYSTAAGGSMVHPNVPCMLFTPICPHSLSFRPVILPDSALLELKVPEDARSNAWVSFDGKRRQQLSRGDSVRIRMSQHPLPTINKSDQTDDWFRSLVRCLNWNERLEQKAL